jgi:deazaflavin-dependent oxidoreductase (nitroreductase family)
VTVLDIAGLPNLNLTVRGKKSGVERTTPLLCVPDGDTILIAGSYFGGPKMPLWVGNLRATGGEARVEYGRETFAVHAKELSGEERAAAWRTMLTTWPNYAKYEERTDRTIPVFRLSRG